MNGAINGSSCSSPLNHTAEKIGKTIAYSLIVVIALIGNSFIGIIVYRTQTLRKPINYFTVNMAMSDLLVPIFMLPWNLTELYVDSWLIGGSLGQALCKLILFLANVSTGVSVQSLVLIAVDRFGAVVFPLRSPLISPKLCPFFILTTWVVAMALFSPSLLAYKVVEYPDGLVCESRWKEAFGESFSGANYILATFVVYLYIPTTLLAILYAIIVFKLKIHKVPGEQSVNAEEQRKRRNRNVLKMAIAIVVGFVLCWFPFSVIVLQSYYGRLSCAVLLSWNIALFMAFSNCAINPCICFIFSANYRQGFKRLLNCFDAV